MKDDVASTAANLQLSASIRLPADLLQSAVQCADDGDDAVADCSDDESQHEIQIIVYHTAALFPQQEQTTTAALFPQQEQTTKERVLTPVVKARIGQSA